MEKGDITALGLQARGRDSIGRSQWKHLVDVKGSHYDAAMSKGTENRHAYDGNELDVDAFVCREHGTTRSREAFFPVCARLGESS